MKLTAKQKARIREAKEIGGDATLRRTFYTNPGCHKMFRPLATQATKMGLTATYQDNGRWFNRKHLLVVEGPAVEVVAFDVAIDGWLAIQGVR